MEVQGEDGIEFLDLKLKLKNIKIAVNVFAKPLDVILEKVFVVSRGIALRLRSICDTDKNLIPGQ